MSVVTYLTCQRLRAVTLPAVIRTSTEEYDEALEDLRGTCRRYRTALSTVQGDSSIVGGIWAPIYADLLDDLLCEVRAAGLRYDQVADDAGIDEKERLDWRRMLLGAR